LTWSDAMNGGPSPNPWFDRLAPLALAAIVALVWWPELVGQRVFFFFDISTMNLPARAWADRQFAAGSLPEWCPHWGTGFPFIAESQTGVYSPVSRLIRLLLVDPLAFAWCHVTHVWLSGLGAFLLFRHTTGERSPPKPSGQDVHPSGGAEAAWFAAFIAAITWMLGGRLLTHQIHTAWLETLSWTPWILLGLARYAASGRTSGLAMTAAALAFAGLGGALHAVLILGIGAGVFTLGLIPDRRIRLGSLLDGAAAAMGLGVLGSAAIWLPTAELLAHSIRSGGLDAGMAGRGSVAPWMWAAWPIPSLTGTPGDATDWLKRVTSWDEIGLVHGLWFFPLALVGWLRGPARRVLPFALLTVAGLTLAAGDLALASGALLDLPLLSATRIPARFLVLAGIGGCGLMAIGLETLLRTGRGRMAALLTVGLTLAVAAALTARTMAGVIELPGLSNGSSGPVAAEIRSGSWFARYRTGLARELPIAGGSLAAGLLAIALGKRWPQRAGGLWLLIVSAELGLAVRHRRTRLGGGAARAGPGGAGADPLASAGCRCRRIPSSASRLASNGRRPLLGAGRALRRQRGPARDQSSARARALARVRPSIPR
jgi:hypothetical protein